MTILLAPAMAQAAPNQTYKLAVVVEAGQYMNDTWQGSTRGGSLLKALAIQINTLPVHIEYKLWLINENTTVYDKSNWPRQLEHFAFSGNPNMITALEEACQWLNGDGSLLFIGNHLPHASFLQTLKTTPQMFAHVLSLETGESMSSLALAGGGGWLDTPSPRQILPYSRAAFKNAITPGRLQLILHNQENQKIELEPTLQRNDILEKNRTILSWRIVQLQPGNYRITWPAQDSLPGPGALPERLTVGGPDGQDLHIGGMGSISVSSVDTEGVEQNWPLAVLDAASGKLWESKRSAPFTLSLPVGVYRVYSTAPIRQEWRFALTAGQHLAHAFGPRGSILEIGRASCRERV